MLIFSKGREEVGRLNQFLMVMEPMGAIWMSEKLAMTVSKLIGPNSENLGAVNFLT